MLSCSAALAPSQLRMSSSPVPPPCSPGTVQGSSPCQMGTKPIPVSSPSSTFLGLVCECRSTGTLDDSVGKNLKKKTLPQPPTGGQTKQCVTTGGIFSPRTTHVWGSGEIQAPPLSPFSIHQNPRHLLLSDSPGLPFLPSSPKYSHP